MAGLCLPRQIAFAAAACTRARGVFALCHGPTPVDIYDHALTALWDGIRHDDLSAIEAVYEPLANMPEANCDDTLHRDWLAWLALATFEFPAALIRTRLPAQKVEQGSALMLTIMHEIDLRLGWNGPPRRGELACAEWAAQLRCLAILEADPVDPEIPVANVVSAGREVAQALAVRAERLAAATGWRLSRPAPEPERH